MPTFTVSELRDIGQRALARAGASEPMARITTSALVDAEAQGLSSHGVARVAQYARHLRNGRADGRAVPV
ncbi:MAG: Ldh family oxidoreductase, partial [Pseudomonadota bacterium]|nr:Ldh family oxidoreductase [Pseudomonadota bacterium]